jgi:tight adherence protein B
MDPTSLIASILFAVCGGGLFYALFFQRLASQEHINKRKAQFQKSGPRNDRDRSTDLNKRRQQIAQSIRDLETDQKKRKSQSVENLLAQAGTEMSVRNFYIGSAVAGVVGGALFFVLMKENAIFFALGAVVVFGVGLPRFLLSYLAKKRIKKFLDEFPGAVDVIIRGVKAGLPIGQCIGIIASEAPEPVRSEFRRIVEAQSIGMSVAEAVDKLPERMPLPEAAFFAIVINLQQKAGGNLSEALGNLSKVLRDRKKMRLKIIAMSSEARTSAAIIGALPFAVGLLVWLTSPDYINLLFIHKPGHIILGVSAVWMSIGVAVMKKLISFDI